MRAMRWDERRCCRGNDPGCRRAVTNMQNSRVEKAMLYGVGLGLSQLQRAAADVENGTQLEDCTTNTEDLDDVQFMGLLELITAIVCHADCEAGGVVLEIRSPLLGVEVQPINAKESQVNITRPSMRETYIRCIRYTT